MPQNHPRGLPRDGKEDTMDSKEIVRRLVVGSRAIDRMRKEIDSVVSTVLGLVLRKHELECWHGEFSKRFDIQTLWSSDFPGCKWYFVRNGEKPENSKSDFEAECCLNIGFGEARFARKYGKFDISHRHVQQVYESLPLFVDGMRKLFPSLVDWQLFLDAADYAEKNGW